MAKSPSLKSQWRWDGEGQFRGGEDWLYSTFLGFLTNELFNKTNTKISLSFNEYKGGNWSNNKFTAEELYNRVTPELSDLVKKIVVKKILSSQGDSYEKLTFSFNKGVESNYSELKFTRKDYYVTLKNYCVSLRYLICLAYFCLLS